MHKRNKSGKIRCRNFYNEEENELKLLILISDNVLYICIGFERIYMTISVTEIHQTNYDKSPSPTTAH